MSLDDLKSRFFREAPRPLITCAICGATNDEVPVYDVRRFVITLNTRLCVDCERRLKEMTKATLEMVIKRTPRIVTDDRDFHTIIGLLEAELPFCINLLRKRVLVCDEMEVRKLVKRIKEYLNRVLEFVMKCEQKLKESGECGKKGRRNRKKDT